MTQSRRIEEKHATPPPNPNEAGRGRGIQAANGADVAKDVLVGVHAIGWLANPRGEGGAASWCKIQPCPLGRDQRAKYR